MADGGLPDSVCTCPYGLDCKQGIAALLEYLKRIKTGQPVSLRNIYAKPEASPLALAAAGLRMLDLRGWMLRMISAPKEICA